MGQDLYGRKGELDALCTAVDDLKRGVRRLYCLLGHRKMGKTSLFAELGGRMQSDPTLLPCRVDLFAANTPSRFFVHLALGLMDAYLQRRRGASLLTGLMNDDLALATAAGRIEALGVRSIDRALRSVLEILRGDRGAGRHYATLIDFPAELAEETGMFPVILLDEFQEVVRFDEFKEVRETLGPLLKLLRARWQHHAKVAYFISGSEVALLEEMIVSESSPLFGHFVPLHIGPFSQADAVGFLEDRFSRSGLGVPRDLVRHLAETTGGHPFYMQVLGEDLCLRSDGAVLDPALYREILQDALFSATGRLQLHFAHLFEKYVGRATTLERVLVALATGHNSTSSIARKTSQQTGAVSTALRQLARRDLSRKNEDGTHAVVDRCFGLWLSGNRSVYRTIAGPYHLGDDAERALCVLLGREGFSLVYRSRGSRGAFDLLALLGTEQIGLQVKRVSRWPVYLPLYEHDRMLEWGKKLRWRPVLAAYDPERDEAVFFDAREPQRTTRKSARFDEASGASRLLKLL